MIMVHSKHNAYRQSFSWVKEFVYIMIFNRVIQEMECSDGWMRHVSTARDCHALHVALDGAIRYSYSGQVSEGKETGMCGSLELAKG